MTTKRILLVGAFGLALCATTAIAESSEPSTDYREDLDFLEQFVEANSAALAAAEAASADELRRLAENSYRRAIKKQGCAEVWPSKSEKGSRKTIDLIGKIHLEADLAELGIDPLARDLSNHRRGIFSEYRLPSGHDLEFLIDWLSKGGTPPELTAFQDFDDRLFGCIDCSDSSGVIGKLAEAGQSMVKDGFLIVEQVGGATHVTLGEGCNP